MSNSSVDSIHPSTAGPSSLISTALSSPHLDPTDPPAPTNNQSSNLDDVFGSSPPDHAESYLSTTPTLAPTSAPAPTATTTISTEPSDLPSLRRQHVTAGYRDGVAVAKTAHVQDGFDGGYPVGAEMGVRVGIVLGVLEGIVNAGVKTNAATDKDKEAQGRMGEVFEEARRELDVRSVFGGAMGETFEDGRGGEVDVKERLARAGEEVIARWEGRVEELLATLK